MTTTTDRTTEQAARRNAMAALGLSMTATFVPQSQSRNRDDKTPTLNWLCDLKIDGREYRGIQNQQGIGHVPGRPQWHGSNTLHQQELLNAYDSAAESGTYPRQPVHLLKNWQSPSMAPRVKLPSPTLEDVLYSLLTDAEAGGRTFEDWAGDFGYDTDSRKAEAMFRECQDVYARLVKLLGSPAAIESLRVVFQDY